MSYSARFSLSLIVSVSLSGVLLHPAAAIRRTASLPDFDISKNRGEHLLQPLNGGRAPRVNAGWSVRWSALTGVASRLGAGGAPLSGPSGESPERIARGFLRGHAELFPLTDADHASLSLERGFESPELGLTHVTLGQQVGGIPVFLSHMRLHVNTRGEVLAASGTLMPRLAETVNARAPRLGAGQALRLACRSVGEVEPPLVPRQVAGGPRAEVLYAAAGPLREDADLRLVYLATGPRETRLAWETDLQLSTTPNVYHVLVDAVNGQLLYRHNRTAYEGPSGLVYDRESPQDGTPFLGFTPPLQSRALKPFDGSEFFPATDPHVNWWAGAQPRSTSGNNAQAGVARLDKKLTLFPGKNGSFAPPLDLNTDPVQNQASGVVNLFYWINRCHDTWYGFGFNEAAGNFQRTNFGNGGVEKDPVLGYAQDGADLGYTDNASFATLPDGKPGEMRMFVWDITNPQRDGDLASDVICHEFFHGVSNRLIGNADGLVGFQAESMGEGWSDFASLMLHAVSTDDLNARHPLGGWVINDFARGIRTQPYSVSHSVFTQTYRNIADARGAARDVHDAGEVMCNTLWEGFVRLSGRLGFEEGRKRTLQLLIDALKLTPDNPSFLDFRDALLTADGIRYGAADVDDLWAVFAGRGMGVSAATTGTDDAHPREGYDVPSTPNALPYSIEGDIRLGQLGVPGVTVTAGGHNTLTDAEGHYRLTGVLAGPYTVWATRPGYTFSPASAAINVSADTTGVNFAPVGLLTPPSLANLRVTRAAALAVTLSGDLPVIADGAHLEMKSAKGAWIPVSHVTSDGHGGITATNLSPKTAYTFRARTYNAAGLGEVSTEVQATTTALQPPTEISIGKQSGTIQLRWHSDPTMAAGYLIEASVNGGKFKKVTTMPVDAEGVDFVRVPAATFSFRIYGTAGRALSQPSGTYSITIP